MNADMRFYVYVYYFADADEVFYVGRGCGHRVKQLSGRSKEFVEAIMGTRPVKRIVCRNLTLQESKDLEVKTINQCKFYGHPLVNRQHAGAGYHCKTGRGTKHQQNAYEAEIRSVAARYRQAVYG